MAVMANDEDHHRQRHKLAVEIALLEEILNTGADLVTIDGVTTRYDLGQVRQRLRDLYRERDRRGHVDHIDLSRGFH